MPVLRGERSSSSFRNLEIKPSRVAARLTMSCYQTDEHDRSGFTCTPEVLSLERKQRQKLKLDRVHVCFHRLIMRPQDRVCDYVKCNVSFVFYHLNAPSTDVKLIESIQSM